MRGARWEACGRPGALPQLRQRYHRSIGRPRAAMGGQGGWEAKCAACPDWRRAHCACQIALTAGSIADDSCLQPARAAPSAHPKPCSWLTHRPGAAAGGRLCSFKRASSCPGLLSSFSCRRCSPQAARYALCGAPGGRCGVSGWSLQQANPAGRPAAVLPLPDSRRCQPPPALATRPHDAAAAGCACCQRGRGTRRRR